MREVRIEGAAESSRLVVAERTDCPPGPGEVAIDIVTAGVNKTDLRQRIEPTRVPPGASRIPGLEIAGVISEVGAGVDIGLVGSEVVALLSSGGYADHACVDVRNVLPAPKGVPLAYAGGLPEVAATAVLGLLDLGRYVEGERVLIHGGTGGVGGFSLQLMHALGATVYATAGGPRKVRRARELGADLAIDYRTDRFEEVVRGLGGVDLVLDVVGGPYLTRNIEALRDGGRIVTIGLQGGATTSLNLSDLMRKKASIIGTLLRDRSIEAKQDILTRVHETVWPLLELGRIDPCISDEFTLANAELAHKQLQDPDHMGKIILTT